MLTIYYIDMMAVYTYRRNLYMEYHTLIFLCSYPTQRTTKESNL